MDLHAAAVATAVGVPSVRDGHPRIAAGDPQNSLVVARMSSRVPVMQMPPLGTKVVDREAVGLVTRWISQLEH